FKGKRDQAFYFFGGMIRPLGNDFDLRRREVGIGVHRHSLERNDSSDRDEPGQHQHQELLPQRRLDYSVDHSVVDTILESLSAGELSIPVRPTWPRLRPSTCWTGETPVAPLTLQRIRKLQEQAAIPDDPVAGFQTAGNLRLPIQTFSERNRASAKLVRRCRGINKRLVLGIAQDSRIRERNGILNLARVYSRNHVH